MNKLDKNFWNQRYIKSETGWDIGYASTPLKEYIDGMTDMSIKILIPGCGNAYEAEYLFQKGFINTHVLDISDKAVEAFKKRCPAFPENQIHCANFFDFDDKFDLILEQTFFCALDVSLRADYAKQMSSLLNNNGTVVGVLFDFPLSSEGPPFGGSQKEYENLFNPYFDIIILERCYNSIAPRMGSELFIKIKKKELEDRSNN